jgi:hypothetical protein
MSVFLGLIVKLGSFRPLAVELNAADNLVRSLPEEVALTRFDHIILFS